MNPAVWYLRAGRVAIKGAACHPIRVLANSAVSLPVAENDTPDDSFEKLIIGIRRAYGIDNDNGGSDTSASPRARRAWWRYHQIDAAPR